MEDLRQEKNTLGTLLIEEFNKQGDKSILLDLDTFVEEFNPSRIWNDEQVKAKDQEAARVNFANNIDKYLEKKYIVIAIGERFLTKEDISNFIKRLKVTCPIYLYHLNTLFSLRKQRLHERGPHSLIDLDKDQKERDLNKKWYGYGYENSKSPYEDTVALTKLFENNKGLLDVNQFK
jgi:hypothetical protein